MPKHLLPAAATGLPETTRRSLLAGAAGLLAAATVPAATVLASPAGSTADCQVLRAELLAAIAALEEAKRRYDEVKVEVGPKIPRPGHVLVPMGSPGRSGHKWDTRFKIPLKHEFEIDEYFDRHVREAREAAPALNWSANILPDFIAETERHREAALATYRDQEDSFTTAWKAFMGEVEEALHEAYNREDEVEHAIRQLPPDTPDSIALKLFVIRKWMDPDDEYPFEMMDELLDELVESLEKVGKEAEVA